MSNYFFEKLITLRLFFFEQFLEDMKMTILLLHQTLQERIMLMLIFRCDIKKKEQIASYDLLKKIFFKIVLGVSPYRDYFSRRIIFKSGFYKLNGSKTSYYETIKR